MKKKASLLSLVTFAKGKINVTTSYFITLFILCYTVSPKQTFGARDRAKLSHERGSIQTYKAHALTQEYACDFKDGTL